MSINNIKRGVVRMKTLLLGDICSTYATEPLYKSKDIDTLFTDTVTLFDGIDFSFVNLETAVCDEDESPIKKFGPSIKSPYELVEVIKTLGVNCCGLSNNHFFDYGISGAEKSIHALDKAGIIYTGFGENYFESRKNLVIEKDGEKVCIIAVCEHEYSYALEDRMGSRPFDEYDTIEDIRNAKKENDCVIVLYHGGKEYCKYPSPRLHKLCHAMAKNGADIILCQHSHCIGTYEFFCNCHILYGQGNFHFVKPVQEEIKEGWNSSFAVQYDTISKDIELVPLSIYDDSKGISLAKGREKEKILSDFYERNKKILSGEWKKEWHTFCEEKKEQYFEIIKKACTDNSTQFDNDFFAHYLDCEAHTDVWRELFPSYNLTNEK